MRSTALRRALLLLVPLALVAVVAPAPGSADVTRMMTLAPNAAFTGAPAALVATTRGAYAGSTGELVITPTGSAEVDALAIGDDPLAGQYRAPVTAAGSGERWDALLDLRDAVSGTPAAPGLYDAGLVLDGSVVEACTGCFTVLTRTAPTTTCSGVSPRRLRRGETLPVVVAGASLADQTVLDLGDPLIGVWGASVQPQGADSGGLITRDVSVDPEAPLGYRTVRLTNSDGRTSTLAKCFAVTAPADKVEPTGATNDGLRRVRVSVPDVVPAGAKLRLLWAGPGGPSSALDLVAAKTVVTPGSPSVLEADVDFTGATPGLNAYQAGYALTDGSLHGCDGLCRFTVRQAAAPAITSLKGLSKATTRLRTLTLTGTGFTRGTTVESGDALVVVTKTTFTSPTSLTVVVAVDPEASGEPVVFTVSNPDDQASQYTSDPLEPGPPGPAVPVVLPEDGDPDPSRAPTTPTLRLPTRSALAQQALTLTGTADPGTAVDLFALTRPAATPVLLRTVSAVGDAGTFSFLVSRAGNTRFTVVSRNGYGRTASGSVGLQVRSAVTLAAPRRTRALTYQFTGTVLPRRTNQRVNVYDVTRSTRVLLGHGFTDRTGGWRLTAPKRFLRAGTLRVQAVTASDAVNAPGSSPVQKLAVR